MFTAKIADIWLAGPTPRELARAIRPVPDFGLQEISALRAPAITLANRQCDKLTLSFEASHYYENASDCLAEWVTDHVAAIRAVGKSLVTLTYPDNTQRFLPNALVKCTPLNFVGTVADYRYEIHAGEVLGPGMVPLFFPCGPTRITGSNISVSITGAALAGEGALHFQVEFSATPDFSEIATVLDSATNPEFFKFWNGEALDVFPSDGLPSQYRDPEFGVVIATWPHAVFGTFYYVRCRGFDGTSWGEYRVGCSGGAAAIGIGSPGTPGLQGGKGDKGDQGDTGPQGPQGPSAPELASITLVGSDGSRVILTSVNGQLTQQGITP